MTRFSSRCVATDCAPVTPSIRGSITSVTLSGVLSSLAFENRSLAALSSAVSNATGVGGGGAAAGGGGAAAAEGGGAGCWACALRLSALPQTVERHRPRKIRAIVITQSPMIKREVAM